MNGRPAIGAKAAGQGPSVVRLENVSYTYKRKQALKDVTLELPAGCMVGLIGPDGVGKSTLLALVAGARQIQQGEVTVLGGSMRSAAHRRATGPRIAYMPQGLGKNLYPTLSVFENVAFFGHLFGHKRAELHGRIRRLLEATGLAPFADRPAAKLSGGMKQKLGLCCSLIHDPDLLILDEPTTGVDPLSRRQFWDLVAGIRSHVPGMSVLLATAYMEEAAGFDWLIAMDGGVVLATGTPADLLARTGSADLDAAFIQLLPEEERRGHKPVEIAHRKHDDNAAYAIEAQGLTKKFGDFTAVHDVSFRIPKGEIFGFLGSNGCGKTTTMKMLTGLLPATAGTARLFGREVDPNDIETRRHVGYMSQSFSLYSELTVRQNLVLHARLFQMPERDIPGRVAEMAERFSLKAVMGSMPGELPLGVRQRLSLAVAMIHGPDILILDEPTSGVDPIARDELWQDLIDLSRRDNVTIFISTHFMNEAERCDRISLMHAGEVLVSDTPEAIVKQRGAGDLEAAFIMYLEDAASGAAGEGSSGAPVAAAAALGIDTASRSKVSGFSLRRMMSYAGREGLELRRDPIRATLALLGSLILMIVVGYGVSMDVEDLSFAVLDFDQSTTSQSYINDISGSRYFVERPPIKNYEDMDRRMRSGELSLALEFPPGFGRDMARGRPVQIGAWIDGAMPQRAETVRGYVAGMHTHWLSNLARTRPGGEVVNPVYNLEVRYRYNPNVESIKSIVPGSIPMLLMMIPAMLTALSVVREKELGSIINLYVTPVTRLEFLLGKQFPYVLLGMVNFLLLTLLAIIFFRVSLSGSFLALSLGALLYVCSSTGFGLLISTFTRSQIAAVFGTAMLTLMPLLQFSGLIDPVSSLEGFGAFIGRIYPATYMIIISRGTFAKGLNFSDLSASFIPLVIAAPVILVVSVMLLKKQAT